MYNNQNIPGYYPNNGGYAYGVARPQPANSQPLTQDIVNTLRQEANEFNMKIDQRDIWRAICTHRDPSNGAMTLTYNADGTCTCSICGETFRMFDGDVDDVKKAVETVKDIMQTTKTLYMDAPRAMTENYHQQIALLDKLPGLWKHSVNNFAKYENVNSPLNPMSGNYSGFGALNTLLTTPYNMYYQQAPMAAAPMAAAPMAPTAGAMPQNPMMMAQQAPMAAAPMAPTAGVMPQNPMMMAPMYGYGMDATNPIAYGNPAMMAQQAPMAAAQQATAPAAPAPQNNEVQQQKVYNV